MTSVNPAWQRVAVVGICASAALFVGGSAWQLVGLLAPVLGLFFGGWLLSCVLEPLVGWLMRTAHISRSRAVLITFAAVLVAFVVVCVALGPALSAQVNESILQFPATLDSAEQRIVAVQRYANTLLTERGFDTRLDLTSGPALQALAQQVGSTALLPLTLMGQVLGAVGSLGMMLLLSVFFLAGGPQLAEQVIQAFGNRAAPDVRFVLNAVHDTFDSFARTQLLQGLLFAAGVWVCLALAHVDAAPLVGLASGALLLIPVVGALFAVLLPAIVTALWNPTASLIVAGVLIVLEQIVLNVVGPRLMSQRLGLPPLLVLFGVLAGGQLAGFWGAVFGIPILAAVLTCIDHFRPRWSSD